MGIFSKIADAVTGGGVKVHLQWTETAPGKPRLVLARTVKGKGVSFMEASDGWHAGHLTAEQYQAAMAEVAR